jgi:3-oxoacyl-[acyl-carrier-protein] synthase-3
MELRSRIVGCGGYLPEKIVTNGELSERLATSDAWIAQRTGIRQRHVAAVGELTSDLAVAASRQALKSAGMTGNDLECRRSSA